MLPALKSELNLLAFNGDQTGLQQRLKELIVKKEITENDLFEYLSLVWIDSKQHLVPPSNFL